MPLHRLSALPLCLLLLAGPALAQTPLFSSAGESIHSPIGVEPIESIPARPLVVAEDSSAAYAGLTTSLGAGGAFGFWSVPLGVAFGLAPGMEAGLDLLWVLKPFNGSTFLGTARPYLRSVLIDELVAFEVALHVPTVFVGALGLELLVPVHYSLGFLETFGSAQLQYGIGTGIDSAMNQITTHSFALALAGTAMYDVGGQLGVAPGFFVVADLAYAFASLAFATRYNDSRISFGLGLGYKVLDDTIVKASFFFTDLAASAAGSYNGFDGRGAQLVVVQGFNLAR